MYHQGCTAERISETQTSVIRALHQYTHRRSKITAIPAIIINFTAIAKTSLFQLLPLNLHRNQAVQSCAINIYDVILSSRVKALLIS